MKNTINSAPHRRYNILTGEWILVSPQRTKRPWQGKTKNSSEEKKETYLSTCYLCPENTRSNGEKNPDYKDLYVFENDFPALLPNTPKNTVNNSLLKAESEAGICKVVCFSPNHSLTLPVMEVKDIVKVIKTWKKEYKELGAKEFINYVQIFENKGELWGVAIRTRTVKYGLKAPFLLKFQRKPLILKNTGSSILAVYYKIIWSRNYNWTNVFFLKMSIL